MQPRLLHVALALGAVYLIWGSVYLGIRLVIDDVDPFQAMAQRFVVAGLLLVLLVGVRRGWGALRLSRREAYSLVLTGTLLLGIGNSMPALAQSKGLPSGVTALVVATVPAWVALLRALSGDPPRALTLVGVVLGLIGLAVLVLLGQSGSDAIPVIGVMIVLVGAISWSIGSFVQGRLRLPRDVLVVAAYQTLVAAGCSAVLGLVSGEQWSIDYSTRGWGAMAYLIVVCSLLGFTAYAWLLANVPLSLTATHAYVNPVVAVLLGWLVLSEPVGPPVLVGGALVVAAVVLVVSGERSRPTVSP